MTIIEEPVFLKHQNLLLVICILLGGVISLAIHASYYYPFFSDDSLISLRYADRLLDGKGLTWTDGKPVEGYSNLLWILLISLLGLTGMDLIVAARILGLAGMATVMLLLVRMYTPEQTSFKAYLPLSTSLFFFCMAAPIAVWSIGGLEQPLYAALIALSIPLTIKLIDTEGPHRATILYLSLILGLISLTRPDGPLFCVAAFFAVLIGRLTAGKRILSIAESVFFASLPLVFYGGQLLFRLSYYGEFLPNTALVKITPSQSHLANGIEYILQGIWSLFPFSGAAILFIIAYLFLPTKRKIGIPLFTICFLWMAYLIFIGGDIFPSYRHLVPIIVVFAFALADGTQWILHTISGLRKLTQATVITVSLAILCTLYAWNQFSHPTNKKALTERWEWDGKVVGLLLKTAFREQQPLLAVTAAGSLPYWSELPSLDMLGLNDYFLPRNPPKDIGKGLLGHELGNGQYVLDNQPDIIAFHTGLKHAVFRSGREMQKTKEFYDAYTPIQVLGTYPHQHLATIWFRKYSPKIGIRKTTDTIDIPGFLLNRNPNTIAYLHSSGKLVSRICSLQSAGILIDNIAHQNWTVKVKASAPDISSSAQYIDGSLQVTISPKTDDCIDIERILLVKKEANQ